MKRCLLLLSFLATTAAAQNTAPAANRSVAYRAGHEVYRHFKASFTDIPIRREWMLYSVGTILINGANLATSIKGRHLGLIESQPMRFFIGQYPSAFKLTFAKVLFTAGQLTTLHKLDEMMTDSCGSEASDPNSRWNHTEALSHDPASCAWNVPGAGMVGWTPVITATIGNINYLDGSKGTTYPPTPKPDLSHVAFVHR
jgi:hypothetical protein